MNEAGKGTHEESLSDDVGRIAVSAREVAVEAVDAAKQQVKQVRKYAEGRTQEVGSWIKERPITSILIGAAVGYLLARMTR